MAKKSFLKSYQTITDESMGADVTSLITVSTGLDNIGMQVKWTSSDAVGIISVQASLNYDEQTGTGDWYDLTFPTPLTQPSSNNGGYLINLNQFPFPVYRIKYTRTSGTGTLNAWTCAKVIGG